MEDKTRKRSVLSQYGKSGKVSEISITGKGNPNFGHGSTEYHCSTKTKSRDYKERQVDRKKRKVFVTAHVILRTAAMFLASALNRGSYPPPENIETRSL